MKKYVRSEANKTKKGGGEFKPMIRIMFLVLLAIGVVSTASYAITTDAFTISITPVLNYSVMISTGVTVPVDGDWTYNLSALGELVYSTQAAFADNTAWSTATVYNNGNVTADWRIKGVVLTGSIVSSWTLGTAGLNDNGPNRFTVAVVLASTAGAKRSMASIVEGDFETDDLLNGDWQDMSDGSPGPDRFGIDAYGDDVEKVTYNAKVLYYRVRMPTDVNSGDEQRITINIAAVTAATF